MREVRRQESGTDKDEGGRTCLPKRQRRQVKDEESRRQKKSKELKRLITGIAAVIAIAVMAVNAQWTQRSNPNFGTIRAILANKGYIFIGGDTSVYRSSDSGRTWSKANNGLPGPRYWVTAYCIAGYGNYILAGSSNWGIYRSSNNGDSWTAANTGVEGGKAIRGIVSLGRFLFAGAIDSGVFRSTDSGAIWVKMNYGLSGDLSKEVTTLSTCAGRLLAETYGGIYMSSDSGATWLRRDTVTNLAYILDHGHGLLEALGSGLFESADTGVSWGSTIDGSGGIHGWPGTTTGASAMTICTGSRYRVIAGAGTYGVCGLYSDTWTLLNSGLASGTAVYYFATFGNYLYAWTNKGMWRSPLSYFGVSAIDPQEREKAVQHTAAAIRAEYAKGSVKVSYSGYGTEPVYIGIYTVSGKTIVQAGEKQSTGAITLNTGILPAGVYVCKVGTGNYLVSSRFVVNN